MNTDKIPTESVATQTLMPRSNVSFKRFLDSRHSIQPYDDDMLDEDTDDPNEELFNIERRLKTKKKLSRQRSTQKSNINIVIEDETSDVIAKESIGVNHNDGSDEHARKFKDSESEYEDSIHEDHHQQPDILKGSVKRPKTSDATFSSWHDLDFPDEKVELPRTYFTDGPTPWSNYKDLVLGQRFLNARLSPIPQRQPSRPNVKQVTWSDSQVKVVSDLIQEANALLEMFDQVSMLLGPDIKLHNVSGEISTCRKGILINSNLKF